MHRIFEINACGESKAEAAWFVLDDLKDAYAAYEHMSGGAIAPSEDAAYEFVAEVADANVAIIAFDNDDAALSELAKLKSDMAIYAIRFDSDVFPSQAGAALERACKQQDKKWLGELLISIDVEKLLRFEGKPRMGWRRRKLSEATDRFIACIRAGISVGEAPALFGATKKQAAHAERNLIIV